MKIKRYISREVQVLQELKIDDDFCGELSKTLREDEGINAIVSPAAISLALDPDTRYLFKDEFLDCLDDFLYDSDCWEETVLSYEDETIENSEIVND